MPYPDKPDIDYSYDGFSQSLGDGSFPGSQLDNDLAELQVASEEIIDFLNLFVRSDGVIKVEALPNAIDLNDATATATAAAALATTQAGIATTQATTATTQAGIATTKAAEAAASALSVNPTNFLAKSGNLSGLADLPTSRTNLGLGSWATKSSLVLADVSAGFFTADATGLGKFVDGFLTADTAGRAKMANGFVDYTKVATGAVVQVVNAVTTAVATGTTILPNDDTIPQITEGTEFLTCAITPKATSNILRIDVSMQLSPSASANIIAALFQDATANALACGFQIGSGSSEVRRVTFTHFMTAGTTSATTFRVRCGMGTAGTLTLNGNAGARLFGGVSSSTISITEIKG